MNYFTDMVKLNFHKVMNLAKVYDSIIKIEKFQLFAAIYRKIQCKIVCQFLVLKF